MCLQNQSSSSWTTGRAIAARGGRTQNGVAGGADRPWTLFRKGILVELLNYNIPNWIRAMVTKLYVQAAHSAVDEMRALAETIDPTDPQLRDVMEYMGLQEEAAEYMRNRPSHLPPTMSSTVAMQQGRQQ